VLGLYWARFRNYTGFCATSTRMKKLSIILALLAVVVAGCGRGYYIKQTERFAAQARSTVNPAFLQEWATNLIAKTPIENRATWVNPDFTGIPKSIVGLSDFPVVVSVTRSPDSGDAYVIVQLRSNDGGPFRGFLVGNKSFKVKVGSDLRTYGDQWLHVVPWQPGIYIWGEL